jgi:outer membrane protein insertion porin family
MNKYQISIFIALSFSVFSYTAYSQEGQPSSGEISVVQSFERILFVEVKGSQRIEPDTIRSYMTIKPGDLYNEEIVDKSLKILFNTGLFADVAIRHENSGLIVFVVENPIINRIDFEGNKALKTDKFEEEVELSPRSVYTRSKVQSDVQRLVELYRRSGRFSAIIEPKVIRQPQNRVDLIFEINEGPTTGVSSVNFLGNKEFKDRKLKGKLVTKESKWWKFFSSDDSYDPDKLAYDREELRKFYLDEGFADFQVISAVAELTKDGSNFIITYVLDEGREYEFGESTIESSMLNMDTDEFISLIDHRTGNKYKATDIDSSIDRITLAVGEDGYASAEVRPRVKRDKERGVIDIVYFIEEGPRVYVEKVNINQNSRTRDEVIRRELRVIEGDSYNKVLIDRSETKIKSLGFFKEVDVSVRPGSTEDRMIIDFNVEEQPTGELSVGAGFSSAESLLLEIGISERNLLGRGQSVKLNIANSERRKQFEIGFTQPYFMGRRLSAGFDIFHIDNDYRKYSSYRSMQSGASLRAVWPMSDFSSLSIFYRYFQEEVSSYNFDSGYNLADDYNANKSEIGYSYIIDTRDDYVDTTSGWTFSIGQDLAGLLGDSEYLKTTAGGKYYYEIAQNWVISLGANAGYVYNYSDRNLRINDRFFKGGTSFRGFDRAGVGPKELITDRPRGAEFFAISTIEITIPLGLPDEFGLKTALFSDFGVIGKNDDSDRVLNNYQAQELLSDLTGAYYDPIALINNDYSAISAACGIDSFGMNERYGTLCTRFVDDATFRATIGVTLNWNSPFGPIRFDIGRAVASEDYDDAKFFRFSGGTRF